MERRYCTGFLHELTLRKLSKFNCVVNTWHRGFALFVPKWSRDTITYPPCVKASSYYQGIKVYFPLNIMRERKWFYPERIKYKKKKKKTLSDVMDFYTLKLCSTSKDLTENIHSKILDERDIRWPRNEYEQGLTVKIVIVAIPWSKRDPHDGKKKLDFPFNFIGTGP